MRFDTHHLRVEKEKKKTNESRMEKKEKKGESLVGQEGRPAIKRGNGPQMPLKRKKRQIKTARYHKKKES